MLSSLFRRGEKQRAPLVLHFEWRSPPVARGYWAYDITITSDGAGEVVMWPDYPAANPRIWRRSFNVPSAHLEPLVAHAGARKWRESNDYMVGGSSSLLEVVVSGRLVRIGSNVDASDREAAMWMHAVARALVPERVLADMERARSR
jgi:hypothetical protein